MRGRPFFPLGFQSEFVVNVSTNNTTPTEAPVLEPTHDPTEFSTEFPTEDPTKIPPKSHQRFHRFPSHNSYQKYSVVVQYVSIEQTPDLIGLCVLQEQRIQQFVKLGEVLTSPPTTFMRIIWRRSYPEAISARIRCPAPIGLMQL